MKLPSRELSQLPPLQKARMYVLILAPHANPETGLFEGQRPKNILEGCFEGDSFDRHSKANYAVRLLKDHGLLVNRRGVADGVAGEWCLIWPAGLPRNINLLEYIEAHSVAAELLKHYGPLRCKSIILAIQEQMGN